MGRVRESAVEVLGELEVCCLLQARRLSGRVRSELGVGGGRDERETERTSRITIFRIVLSLAPCRAAQHAAEHG